MNLSVGGGAMISDAGDWAHSTQPIPPSPVVTSAAKTAMFQYDRAMDWNSYRPKSFRNGLMPEVHARTWGSLLLNIGCSAREDQSECTDCAGIARDAGSWNLPRFASLWSWSSALR